jgi:hypothetical protein
MHQSGFKFGPIRWRFVDWTPKVHHTRVYKVWLESIAQGKISLKRCKLERSYKKEYYWDSYFLFWQLQSMSSSDQLFCRQKWSNCPYIPQPPPVWGTNFRRCTRQVCKKSASRKLLVDNTYGDTRPCWSFKQIVTSNLLKTKKLPKRGKGSLTLWLLSRPPFQKSSGETNNAALSTKALATSQLTFKS